MFQQKTKSHINYLALLLVYKKINDTLYAHVVIRLHQFYGNGYYHVHGNMTI
jgi:hypothetical protein